MAKLMKCPRCQAKIDVTDLSAGSTVRCPDCGGMVRLPSGSTGQYASVPAAAVPAAPRPAAAAPAPQRQTGTRTKTRMKGMGGRQTNLFRKMSGVKAPGEKGRSQIASEATMDRGAARNSGPSTGVIVGIAVGALVVIGAVAFALMGGKGEGQGSGKKDRDESSAGSGRRDRSKKDSKVPLAKPVVGPQAPTENYATFVPGARGLLDRATNPIMDTNSLVKSEYESMVTSNVAGVVAQDQRFFIYIIDGMLSDNEAVARGSMQAMHDIIVRRAMAKDVQAYTQLARDAVIPMFNVPGNRKDEYGYWAMWWFTASSRNLVASWGPVDPSSQPAGIPSRPISNVGSDSWDATIMALRSGGGFDVETSPEYSHYQRVKAMGPAAYPNLIKYIDNEDIMLARAAVSILKALTKNTESKLPNETNKGEVKAYWEGWIKSNPVK